MIIEKVLLKLRQENGGVIGSSVIEKGGFMVAMDAPPELGIEKSSVMAAAVFNRLVRNVESVKVGAIDYILIEGEKGDMLVVDVGNVYLFVRTKKNATIAKIMGDAKDIGKKIEALI
jgi:predicted regulator of Ras-like GTPase activity (Roadblock/LC7/MglB family)